MKNTVKNYLTLLLTAPTILFICLICIFMSIYMLENAIGNIQTDAGNLGDYLAENYDRQIEAIQDDVLENPSVINYLSDLNNETYREEVGAYLTDIANRNEFIRRSSFVSPEGTILISSNPDLIGQNQSDSLFNYCVISEQTQTGMDVDGDLPLMVICYPIYSNTDHHLIAVYRRISPLYYLQDYIINVTHAQKSVYIVTRNRSGLIEHEGQITAITPQTPGQEQIGQLTNLLFRSGPDGESGELDENDWIGAYTIEPDLGWISLVTQSKALIYYDLNRFQLAVIAGSIILLAIIMYAGRRFFRDHIAPVFDYVKNIRDFLAGNRRIKVDEDHPLIIGELGESINSLFAEVESENLLTDELKNRLNLALSSDAVTGLLNYDSVRDRIDETFKEDDSQALIVYDVGTYDELDTAFGKARTDELLKTIAQKSLAFDEGALLGRLKRDIFCLYLPKYESKSEVNTRLRELYEMLTDITSVGDLQIKLEPHAAVVFRDENIENAQAWLDLAEEVLIQAEEDNTPVVVFDYSYLDEYDDDKLTENIFITDTPVWRSYKTKNKS